MKTIRKFLLLIFLIFTVEIVSTTAKNKDEHGILTLKSSTIDHVIRKNKYILVQFCKYFLNKNLIILNANNLIDFNAFQKRDPKH